MKKIIAILMILTMIMVIVSGCGKETEDIVADVTEATTEQETTTQEPTTEEPTTETEEFYQSYDGGEAQNDPRFQEGMKKIHKMIDAYENLITGEDAEFYKMSISYFMGGSDDNENYGIFCNKYLEDNNVITKDGSIIKISEGLYNGISIMNYLDLSVNQGKNVKPFEILKSNTSDDLLSYLNAVDGDPNSYYVYGSRFDNCLDYLEFLRLNKDEILGIYVEDATPDKRTEDMPVDYMIIMSFDKYDDTFFAVWFDENGDMLNIQFLAYLDNENDNLLKEYQTKILPATGESFYDIVNK